MDSSIRNRDGSDFARPRRPNPDTVSYLQSLPLDEEVAREEISTFCNQRLQQQQQGKQEDQQRTTTSSASLEFPPSLAAALTALDEIRQEVASLAGDERGSQVLEVLIKITAPYSVTASQKWLASCQGYVHHLALHRYGSHVLQTILEQAFLSTPIASTSSGREEDLALHPDSPSSPIESHQQDQADGASSSDTVVTKDDLWDSLDFIQQELLPVVSQLKTHLCATHVLRTLFFILGGVELHHGHQQGHRLRGKTKNKKNGQDSSLELVPNPGASFASGRIQYLKSSLRRPSNSDTKTEALDQWMDAVAPSTQLHALQELVCHASGGPLLVVLLQSLTYRESPCQSNISSPSASEAAFRSLGKLPMEPKFGKNSKASVLTKRILHWEEEGASKGTEDSVYGLAGDARGSHVLDTILRLCNDEMHETIIEAGNFIDSMEEYVEHDVSNFVVQTLLATVRSTKVAERMVNACLPLLESGLIFDVNKRRRGILWRLAEMAVQHRVGQAKLLQGLHLKCPRKQLAGALLDPKRSVSNDNRLTLNVEGSRALFHLLHFDCPGAKEIVEGVVAMSVDDLDALARDGLGSRCVWDVIFEEHGCLAVDGIFVKARTSLLTKLKGKWVSLATDRVGHHAVQKLFRTLPTMKAREELVQEMALGRHRLHGNAMGRSILSFCEVDAYKNQGFVEWCTKIQKQIQQREWVQELTSSSNSNSENHSSQAASTNPDVGNHLHNNSIDLSGQAPSTKKRSKSAGMTVDSIFDVLTLPKNAMKKTKKLV